MSLLGGLLSIATSPLRAVVKVVEDVSGNNGESNQMTSVFTLGASSVIKGVTEGIKDGIEQISDS